MIAYLTTINKNKAGIFGSKAAFLGELVKHGITVPPGFAVSVALFHQFLEYNGINFDPGRFLARNNRIQQQLLTGTFPPELKKALLENFHNLYNKQGDGLVVRSSALCEDAEKTSFAGIFKTFTGIHSPENMLDAIKKCYASLLADKALAYALAHKIPFEELQMGIVVQEFIQGRPSGVMFTADTVNMDSGIMVINWVDDVCAAYVEGRAKSRRLCVSRRQNLPEETGGLTGSQLSALIELGGKCEKLLGTFQDIEWTFAGNTLYALQSRPVTTFKQPDFPVNWENEKDKEYTWRKESGPEYLLDQERALASIDAMNKGAFQSGLEWFYEETMYQNGYKYMRLKELPGAEQKRQEYAVYINQLKKQGKNVFTDIYLPRILEIHKKLQQYMHRDLTDTELAAFLDESFHAMLTIMGMHWLVVQGCLDHNTLEEFRETYGLKSWETVLLLQQETWGTKSTEKLFRMLRLVKEEPALYRLFQEHSCAEVIYAHLADITDDSITERPAADALLKLIDSFITDFGLYPLAWYDSRIRMENPSIVAGYIRQFLDRDADAYFTFRQQQEKEQEEFMAALPSRLGKKKWLQLQKDLPYYSKAYKVRDDHSHYIDETAGGFYRYACVLAGKKLKEQGKIDAEEDFNFLCLEEIKQALSGNLAHMNRLITERKQQHEYHSTLFAPPVLGKEPRPSGTGVEESGNIVHKNTVLKGLSGLALIVKGEVRFKKDIPGITRGRYIFVFKDVREIDFNIIFPYTAGLVFEWGSPFEHVGIWARENNIPTLFGVTGVTELLEPGDEVELDGIREELKIISSSGAD